MSGVTLHKLHTFSPTGKFLATYTLQCHGDTHAFSDTDSVCVCGQSALTFNGYHPGGYVPNPHHPRASQSAANEVPLAVFKAAQAVNATHLSADGIRAYCERYSDTLVCFWSSEAGEFGSWFQYLSDIPADAVRLEE